MSTLYLGCDLQAAAARFAEVLASAEGDFFAPVAVVVPNRFVRKWLKLFLARRLGVAINLQFRELDEALWMLLHELDPRPEPHPGPLDPRVERLLILSVLLEERDPDLEPLQRYLQRQEGPLSRLSCRRAWHLADRLADLLANYEQHRHERVIQRWLRAPRADDVGPMERAQRRLFLLTAAPHEGRRAQLSDRAGIPFAALPEYFTEVQRAAQPGATRRDVHVFGLTQIAPLHARILSWLGRYLDLHVYHVNPLVSRVRGTLTRENVQSVAQALAEPGPEEERAGPRSLLRLWGRTAAESLGLVATLLDSRDYAAELLAPPAPTPLAGRKTSVLARLQDGLLGRPRVGPARLPQDTSLQVVGCPGSRGEVESVYNSILHNLHEQPQLRQTDIAVLVTDMARYRPLLQAVFERPPARLQYNLVDFSAAGFSAMGHALLGMLDLAMESFTRSRVFRVLLNPCFLAKLRVDRAQATAWLRWAEELGIYQGWDADEKHEQGYPRTPLYAWRLGLQRLRLARYMEVAPEDADGPAPRFVHVIPFADLASTEREQLDAFSRAVEGLLPRLTRLRTSVESGARWSSLLTRLVHDFLEVPADRPEEAQVRDELLASFAHLGRWDDLHAGAPGLSLPLVREYLQGQLEKLEGSRGEFLVGGVTLASLKPMRPVPFPIVYVLGLSEELFPGSNALDSLDLRGGARLLGDIRPAEGQLAIFLETLLAARQKLYLFYNNHDQQRDQELQPAVPLQQLEDYLSRHVLKERFCPVTMPSSDGDDRFFCPELQPDHQDVLVQYGEAERYLAFVTAERSGRWQMDLNQKAELVERAARLEVDFKTTPSAPARAPTVAVVSLGELRRFLVLPARESLRRHLRVDEDDDPELEDDEPLITPAAMAGRLTLQTLRQLVMQAAVHGVDVALETWRKRFERTYKESRLRCQVPADAFGAIDHAALRHELAERVHGSGGLEDFLRERVPGSFCGPVLLGTSTQPVGARRRFPALRLRAGSAEEVGLVGTTPFAWHSERRFEVLVITNGKAKGGDLSPAVFEPLLLYLALLVSSEADPDGASGQEWLAGRDCQIHHAHERGVLTWTYPAGSVSPAEARSYLEELAADFLDPRAFDLLPFDLIGSHAELRRAYDEKGCLLSAVEYQQLLQERVAEERENKFSMAIPALVNLVGPEVPHDALAKVQRRFRLLERGPARWRAQQERNRAPHTLSAKGS